MPTITVDDLEIPGDVQTLEGFRSWVATLDERAPRVSFYRGEVHIEVSPQNHETHGPVGSEINRVLANLARELAIGMYFMPPSWLTEEAAQLSTEPDGFLVRFESAESGRVRINPERKTELLGAPDMVLEVVSVSTVRKDLVRLREGYARAAVREYWIVDARGERPELRVLVLGAEGEYEERAPDAAGWIASPTWGRSFRLERFVNQAGWVEYRLEVTAGSIQPGA